MDSSEICIPSAPPSKYAVSSKSWDVSSGSMNRRKAYSKRVDSNRRNHDFLSLITAISNVYSSGQYVRMLGLNDVAWESLASGHDFQVGRSSLYLATTSIYDQTRSEILSTRLIVKKVQNLRSRALIEPADMSLFICELMMLHHLRDNDNIVRLMGVGWTYDNLDDINLTPCPKPALLLEEAAGTLKWLIEESHNLSLLTEMKICKDVANGLLAVHESGLFHGDIKPANVLVFKEMVLDEGVEIPHYRCKISDFSLATAVHANTSITKRGTPLFMAPEMHSSDLISSKHIMLADVWSLGILFAQVMQRDLELEELAGNTSALELTIHQAIYNLMESFTSDTMTAEVQRVMFRYTIQQDPADRNLIAIVEQLKMFFERRAPSWNIRTIRPDPKQFESLDQSDLYISYESLKLVSGQVHDVITSSLRSVAEKVDDPRRAKALWELAVISLSGFDGQSYTQAEGLSFLRQSAALGDLRAQGLFHRVQQALIPPAKISVEVLGWLRHSASLGHSIAINDLYHIDGPDKCRNSLSNNHDKHKYLSNIAIGVEVPKSSDMSLPSPRLDLGMASVHLVAAIGSPDNLEDRLIELSLNINSRDSENNTLLIEASRHGNTPVMLQLLTLGANPSLVNDIGENFMHFPQHLNCRDFDEVVSRLALHDRQRIFLQEAMGVKIDPSRNTFPTPPGIPLERAITLGKVSVMRAMLNQIPNTLLPNGLIMRRSLLLALRMQSIEMVKLLLDFIFSKRSEWDESLPPIYETRWEYKDQKRSLIDAILVGGVSGFGLGSDMPLEWWRLCRLGRSHSTAQDNLIEIVLDLVPELSVKESLLDAAFPLVINERFCGSLRSLIEWKALVTDGKQNRLQSLMKLTWDCPTRPENIVKARSRQLFHNLLKTLNFQPPRWAETQPMKYHGGDARATAHKCIVVSNKIDINLQHDCWQLAHSANDMDCLELPEETINYVDQIFYDASGGTLLHQAIQTGDRAMFRLLIDAFGANVNLPAPRGYLGSLLVHQSNGYSLLARASHNDLWFADKLHSLGVGLDTPYSFTPYSDSYYLPPLLQALCCQRWPYSEWLFRKGASLEQPTKPGWDVLSTCLSVEFLSRELLNFLFPFPQNRRGSAFEHLPAQLQESNGFRVLQYIHDHFRPLDLTAEEKRAQRNLEMVPDFSVQGRDTGYEGEGLTAGQCELNNRCRCVSCSEFFIQESVWSAAYLRERLKRHDPETGKALTAYFLDTQGESMNSQEWRKLPRIAQCWHYLLSVYPDVPNIYLQRFHWSFSIPVVRSTKQTRSPFIWQWHTWKFSWQFRAPSILTQSLGLGPYSYVVFALTASHFLERATLYPNSCRFPVQDWIELLHGSPLSVMTAYERRQCVLLKQKGYSRSATDFVFVGPVLVVTCILIDFLAIFGIWYWACGWLRGDNRGAGAVIGLVLLMTAVMITFGFGMCYLCVWIIYGKYYLQKLGRPSQTVTATRFKLALYIFFNVMGLVALGTGLYLGI